MSEPTFNTLFTHAQRKVIADILPKLADRLKLDKKASRTIFFTVNEIETIRKKAEEAVPNA